MSSGKKSRATGRLQHAVVSRNCSDERTTEIETLKAKHMSRIPNRRTAVDARGGTLEAGPFRHKGLPSHVPSSWPGLPDSGQDSVYHDRKSKSPGIRRSPPRPDLDLQRRRSSSESRVSGSSSVKSPKHSEPRFDGSYSYVFPDRSSPTGVKTSGGSVHKTYDNSGEKKGRKSTEAAALGRTGSDASEVQSPLREPDLAEESDVARGPDLETSLSQDLTEKALSFSDTMGLKWLPTENKHATEEHAAADAHQTWANCRDEGPWSIAAGRAASPDSGESFAFPEVLPREVLRFAEAPLKPLPDWDAADCGSPGSGGGPLEQSWLHNRQQETLAAVAASPPARAADQTPGVPTAKDTPHNNTSMVCSPVHSPVRSTADRSAGAAAAAGSARGRSSAASDGLSPEKGNFVRNPAHPLHARSPWSAGLEAYAKQLSDSCPRQPPGSCRSTPRSAPIASTSPGCATDPRPACRSLREQFAAAPPPAVDSSGPPGSQSTASHGQQGAEGKGQANQLGALGSSDSARALLGSVGKALSHSLTWALRGSFPAVPGLRSLIGQPSEDITPQEPSNTPAKLAEPASEGAWAFVTVAAAAGRAMQQQVRRGLAAWRGARTEVPSANNDCNDRSLPSAAQIADAVTNKVIRRQVAFLSLSFLAMSAAAMLPIALMIARHSHAAAVAAASNVAAPVPDSNDYTCLGLPWLPLA